ncbi:EAL domain-containing protein [Hydrogenimonas thermophila]|uniref:EAL domain-containing response regulator n=1 Tax=Hydrogenimonas thermophila TaxID=223786 RepID=UPI00293741F0|nr:EAL domain-containing protein [Hydrogenimonas thermophila]WOE69789.1 EAL domain-containing protein [Hydrogenimonas thermophila]WOE72304.1 EAL domain-containing protein [Hydrogenimonas thermophila]
MKHFDEIVKHSKPLKLLFVEDNQDAREMTAMILEDFFDSITIAVDGVDALEKFKKSTFDIVISDVNMPNMNGLELFKKIREIDQSVSLIFLSAHNEENYFIESIHIGVDSYLLKPIDLEQLSNTLYRVVQKHRFSLESKKNLLLLQEYQEAVNESSIVSKTDKKGIITFVNDAFCKISGYRREELIGKNHNIIRHPDNPKSMFEDMWNTIKNKKSIWKGIVKNRAKNGKSYYTDSLIMPILDLNGDIVEYISIRNDITDIMSPAKQLTDAIKNSNDLILIYIKIEKFDILEEFYSNDTLEMIQEKTKNYLQAKFSCCNIDKVYQLGNGEYGLLLHKNGFTDKNKLLQKVKVIQEQIKEDKIDLIDFEYDISVLISIVYDGSRILESAKLGIKQLLRTGDYFIVANNLAKIKYDDAKKNMEIVSMIKKAISNSRIVSYFQPIIDNKTMKIAKYESLVRLIDENDKVLSPYFFLETSKKTNYYTKITNIVLEYSFDVLKHCRADISINLSAIDIEQKETREKILQLLENNKNYTSRIVFELLEDEDVREFEIIKEFIKNVKTYGVKIAIDDFGAGYSNFERLLDYQPDILKIDGSLIKNIETSAYSISVVKSIVTFAKEQNIKTIAEFIENESIYNIVKELGVDYSQGYYFGKPEPLMNIIS